MLMDFMNPSNKFIVRNIVLGSVALPATCDTISTDITKIRLNSINAMQIGGRWFTTIATISDKKILLFFFS
jgi:hypothetical protein